MKKQKADIDIMKEISKKAQYFNNGGVDDNYDVKEDEFPEDEIDENIIGDVLRTSINSSMTGLQLESIINSLKSGYFLIPGFQRKFIWTKKQVASLALSIIKGIPVPPLYVYVDNKTMKQVILDGQQRVTAIFLYFYGLFFVSEHGHQKLNFKDVADIKERIDDIDRCIGKYNTEHGNQKPKNVKDKIKELREERKKLLSDLREKHGLAETKFMVPNGNKEKTDISFSLFDDNAKEYLKRRDFQIAVVRCDKSYPQKVFVNIFKVLNTGGKILGTQEIRNGIYWETLLYKRLFEVNEENENWRRIYGNISQFSKDIEILLKMLSLNHYTIQKNENIITQYDGTFNWTNIMEGYSEKCMNFSPEQIEEEIRLLLKYLSILDFDDDTRKCNKAVFEAVFVAFCKLGLSDEMYGHMQLKLSWIIGLEEKTDIFEHVLSNKSSVETRLTRTFHEVKKEYAKYL